MWHLLFASHLCLLYWFFVVICSRSLIKLSSICHCLVLKTVKEAACLPTVTEGWQAFYYRSRYYVLLVVEWSAGRLTIRYSWYLVLERWRVETSPSATHSESITCEPPRRCYTLRGRVISLIDVKAKASKKHYYSNWAKFSGSQTHCNKSYLFILFQATSGTMLIFQSLSLSITPEIVTSGDFVIHFVGLRF